LVTVDVTVKMVRLVGRCAKCICQQSIRTR